MKWLVKELCEAVWASFAMGLAMVFCLAPVIILFSLYVWIFSDGDKQDSQYIEACEKVGGVAANDGKRWQCLQKK